MEIFLLLLFSIVGMGVQQMITRFQYIQNWKIYKFWTVYYIQINFLQMDNSLVIFQTLISKALDNVKTKIYNQQGYSIFGQICGIK